LPGTTSLVGIEVDPRDENLVGTPVVQYAADGSNFTAIPLANSGGLAWTGNLPAANCGDTPTYFFEAEGDVSGVVRFPASSDRTFSVGEVQVAVEDEFDAQGDWTVGPDTATTGNWEVATPEATAAQPGAALSPATCWVTDGTAGTALGSFDVDAGQTILTSPAFDLSTSGDPVVSYQRWYNNSAGSSPGLDIFEIQASNDNGASWVAADQAGPSNENTGGWVLSEWSVKDLFPSPSSTFRVRFIAQDTAGASIVEAAIDDFRITETVCIDVPTCTADTTTDGTSNGIPDGAVTLSDFSYYLGLWGASDAAADVTTDGTANGTPDGSVTLSDFSFYLSLWGAGCP
ncbi:MAG: GC-type dockerin domain-anchored protein, partial [Planctomycetota bacterium]